MGVPAPNVSVEKLARRTEKLDENNRFMGDDIIKLLELQHEQTATLGRHDFVLNEHGKILSKHTGLLEEHSRVLAKHTEMLEEQQTTLATHTVLLRDIEHTLATTDIHIRSSAAAMRTQTKFNAAHSRRIDELASFAERQEGFNERQEAFNAGIESKVATVISEVGEVKEILSVILSRLPAS